MLDQVDTRTRESSAVEEDWAPGQIRWDAEASIPDLHDCVLRLPLGDEVDASAALGVFGRIVEQVREHLLQARWVRLQQDGL